MRVVLLPILLLLGCPRPVPTPVPPGPDPRPIVDASPYDVAGDHQADCADVCFHGFLLGCDFARDTPAGASCTMVCENVVGSGFVHWDIGCRARAPTCAAVDACER